jgi:hypothetical protein
MWRFRRRFSTVYCMLSTVYFFSEGVAQSVEQRTFKVRVQLSQSASKCRILRAFLTLPGLSQNQDNRANTRQTGVSGCQVFNRSNSSRRSADALIR